MSPDPPGTNSRSLRPRLACTNQRMERMALAEASCTRHILPKQAAQGTYGVLTLLSPLSQYAFSLPDQHSRPPACLGRAACLGPEAQARQHCRVGGIGGLSLSLPEGSFSLSLSLSLSSLSIGTLFSPPQSCQSVTLRPRQGSLLRQEPEGWVFRG